mgnify:CR=1 FL=1
MIENTFTLVFSGDLQAFNGNPFKTDTPFGRPIAAGLGDAFDEITVLEDALAKLAAERSATQSSGTVSE